MATAFAAFAPSCIFLHGRFNDGMDQQRHVCLIRQRVRVLDLLVVASLSPQGLASERPGLLPRQARSVCFQSSSPMRLSVPYPWPRPCYNIGAGPATCLTIADRLRRIELCLLLRLGGQLVSREVVNVKAGQGLLLFKRICRAKARGSTGGPHI